MNWDEESLGDLSSSVRLDNVQDFGPINEDDEYKHEFGYFLIVLLRGDSIGRELKRNVFAVGCAQIIMGVPLFIMTTICDYRYRSTPFYRPVVYGAPLLSLQYVVSWFAMMFGIISMIAIHHWASLVSNRQLLSKISKGYQGILVTQLAFDIWTIAVLYNTFLGVDYGAQYIYAEVQIVVAITWVLLIPHMIMVAYYVLNINYLQEKIDEGVDIAEPSIPDHAIDLEGVNVIDLLALTFMVPLLLLGQIYDILEEFYLTIVKCWRYHKENRKRAARINRSFYRRISKTCTRIFRKGLGLTKKPPHEMAYADPTVISTAEEDEYRLRQLEEAAVQAEIDREQAEIEEIERKAKADAEALELANAKTLNVKQFREKWNDLPPAGSFQCNVKERPIMKNLVAHMETMGFFIVFASHTGRGLESDDDFELGICNMKGQDLEDYGRTMGRGRKGRAVAVDDRADLAEGLGQALPANETHLPEHKWFMARFRCSLSTFSAVMKTEDPSTMNKYVKKFALAKVLKVDTGRPTA